MKILFGHIGSMKWTGRNLNILLPLKISFIVIIAILPMFLFSYLIVDRFVVRQKLGDLMNLADAKYVHVLDLLDFGKKINNDWATNPILGESLDDYEQSQSEQALSMIQSELVKIKNVGALPRPHAFGSKPLTKERFQEILVTNDKGVVIASTNKSSVNKNLSKTTVFANKQNNTYATNVFRNSSGIAVFAFVSPIFKEETGQKKTVFGYLITEVNTSLLTMIMDADLGNVIGGKLWFAGFQYKALDIYIMDNKGWMITQSRLTKKTTVLKQKGSELPLERGLDENAPEERKTNVGLTTGGREAMEIYRNREGAYVAGASMHLFDEGWTVVVEQDTKDAFAGLFQLKIALIVSGLITAILAGLVAWLATRRITESLAKMGAASVILAGGDFDTQIKVRPNEYNELSVLAASLNLMAGSLKNLMKSKKEE